MRGMHRIAHQHHMAAVGVLQPPLLAHHALKVDPRRAAQMARIGHQPRALQVVGKELLAERNRLRLIGGVQAAGLPGLLGGLDDEGRGGVVELVDVRLKPAMRGAHEVEREGVVYLVRAQPDVAVGARDDVGPEHLGMATADARIHAVAGNDQIGIRIVLVALHIGLEHQLHAQLFAARLQDIEQMLAANAHKAVPARANAAALEQQLNIVPMVERPLNLFGRHRVPLAHGVHGGVREHHAPAKRVIGLIALHHGNVVSRVHLLHQQREIQARRATSDAYDFHGLHPSHRIALVLNYLPLNNRIR
ncbi:hypothetical protein SDC9_114804 [bioreactor metagenome]|uniref:Uncharacterized protein n=1 Tax=bioreactor metagenome TaxID=1076179 RepID=A0A645BR33_9ZZZZ